MGRAEREHTESCEPCFAEEEEAGHSSKELKRSEKESVENRSLESVISCGVQSVCVASGACVRSVKRFFNGRCTTYYIGSGPERMFMFLRVLSRFKTVTDNAASLLAMVSSCTPETGGLASHCGHCPSQRRNSHSGSAPPAHVSMALLSFDCRVRPHELHHNNPPRRAEGFVPEIESWRCGIAKLLTRSRQSPEHSAQRVDSVCNTSTTSSTCPELPASST